VNTVLDLLREYGALSDTKVRRGGTLAPPDEKRWVELNAFFDVLMSQSGLHVEGEKPRFTAGEIREYLEDRNRVRVPASGCAILHYEGACLRARLVNLSRGGAFLAAETLLDIGSRANVFLAGVHGNFDEVLELDGEVTWQNEWGVSEADLPRGMGLRFVNLSETNQEKLDTFVLNTIERQISNLW
jgi:hypothetical protein